MTAQAVRNQRLRALRQQEQAAALTGLRRAEADHARIEAELERVERRLRALASAASPPATGTVASALALESGSARHEITRARVGLLTEQRAHLLAERADSRAAVDRALEAVASATRALKAIGL